MNEEDGNGTLQKTYIEHLAEVPGANPAAGAYAYYATDLIRSTRGLFDANKAQVAGYEFTPYGGVFASSGTVSTTHLYTGHDWDETTDLYYAPYRYFSPDVAQWSSPDPGGTSDGFNFYAYVNGRVVSVHDPLGLYGKGPICRMPRENAFDCMNRLVGGEGMVSAFACSVFCLGGPNPLCWFCVGFGVGALIATWTICREPCPCIQHKYDDPNPFFPLDV